MVLKCMPAIAKYKSSVGTGPIRACSGKWAMQKAKRLCLGASEELLGRPPLLPSISSLLLPGHEPAPPFLFSSFPTSSTKLLDAHYYNNYYVSVWLSS